MKTRIFAALTAMSIGLILFAGDRQSTCAFQEDSNLATESAASARTAQNPDHHHAGVNKRGDEVMGFEHTKTTHHFLLKTDGGIIQVDANDMQDASSREQIRMHLKHIAQKFADGDFIAPMLIHDQTPPGVAVMKQLKGEIKYKFEKTERGGLVRISTGNKTALAAVHEFLRFQIKDHRTGDSGEVSRQ